MELEVLEVLVPSWRYGAIGMVVGLFLLFLWFLKRLGAFESIPSINVPPPEGKITSWQMN